jgi:polysaccharide export outer membrane protein
MRVWLIALVVLLGACPHPNYDPSIYKDLADPRNKEITLGVGDTISINVWENRDFNTEATIRPDGTITMPLVGDIKAAHRTPSDLKKEISQKLQTFLKIAQGQDLVTVAVKQWRSYRFTINGEVTRPGVFSADHFMTVADALALAGGPTRFAKRTDVKLFREDPQGRKTIPLDYDELTSGKRPDMNIWVLPDDVIYVP